MSAIRHVFKYYLKETDVQEVMMPTGAQILHVAQQAGMLCLWVLVELNNPLVERRIRIFGTGHPISVELGPFIGTVMMSSGLVWHIFDQGEAPA